MLEHVVDGFGPLSKAGSRELIDASRVGTLATPHRRLSSQLPGMLLDERSAQNISLTGYQHLGQQCRYLLGFDLGKNQPAVVPTLGAGRVSDDLPLRFVQAF